MRSESLNFNDFVEFTQVQAYLITEKAVTWTVIYETKSEANRHDTDVANRVNVVLFLEYLHTNYSGII